MPLLGRQLSAVDEDDMPLRCVTQDGNDIQAFDLTDQQWSDLRTANRTARHLHMPCCDARVVMKTSNNGLNFFAHKARGSCTTAPETEEHLILKQLAVEAARRAGWACSTEVRGISPTGENWTADVLATKGEYRVAVEIQWSPQTPEETVRRQERYKRSGVRCLWLFRRPGFPTSKDLPAVCVTGDRLNGFEARIPNTSVMSSRSIDEPWRWRQRLPIKMFLDAVFERRFRYGVDADTSATVTVHSGTISCWKCGADTRIITFVEVTVGPHSSQLTLRGLPDELVAEVVRKLPSQEQVGAIKHRFSRTVGHSYMSNGCYHCDALIGEFFEHDAWGVDPKIIATFPVLLSNGWRGTIGANSFGWGIHPR